MLSPSHYSIAIELFLRLVGLMYFFAIGALLVQIRGLLGQEGILPVHLFLKAVKRHLGSRCYFYVPSIFWLRSDDKMLVGVAALGVVCSLMLFLGIMQPLMLFLLFGIYLSIVSTGQDFLSFGWEMFLLELTLNAFLLSVSPTNVMAWISLNFLLFRFHIQAGVVKLQSHDKTWKDLSALSYHYLTQPIPNTQAWYIHKAPLWFHKLSTAFMFFVELIVPFAILFGDDALRLAAFILLVGLQVGIWATGNLSYLNYMTAFFCVILVSNKYLGHLLSPPRIEHVSHTLDALVTLGAAVMTALQALNFWHHVFHPLDVWKKISDWIHPFHCVNRYGIFAVMTTKRYEIVIEGSDDGVHWKEYAFKHKPSEVNRRPRRIAPFQPRLDWQAWFLPFSNFQREPWFQNFLHCLLLGSKPVLDLLRINPFPDKPPKYVRAIVYDYIFSTKVEKRETGAWWIRSYVGSYSPIQTLMINAEKGAATRIQDLHRA